MEKDNSQICTTREQSERLLALGLKKNTADMCWMYGEVLSCNPPGLTVDIPAWSLQRLIEMIQEECSRVWFNGSWVAIDFWGFRYVADFKDNLYDNIIGCIEWLIKGGNFPQVYLEE